MEFSTHHRLPVDISPRRSPRAIAVYSYIVVCVLREGGSGGLSYRRQDLHYHLRYRLRLEEDQVGMRGTFSPSFG